MTDFYAKYYVVLARDLTSDEISWLAQAIELGERHASKHDLEFPYTEIDHTRKYIMISGNHFGDHVVAYIQAFLQRHRPDSVVKVSVAFTASPPCQGGFGGCVYLISAEQVYSMDTAAWGNQALDAMRDFDDPIFLPPVSHQEHVAIMAALRVYKHEVEHFDEPLHVTDIATNMGQVRALEGEGVKTANKILLIS